MEEKEQKEKFNIGRKEKYMVAFLLIAVGAVCYFIGYGSGVAWAMSWTLDKAQYFLDLKGIDIKLNTDLIKDGLQRYHENIGGCWAFDVNGSVNDAGKKVEEFNLSLFSDK